MAVDEVCLHALLLLCPQLGSSYCLSARRACLQNDTSSIHQIFVHVTVPMAVTRLARHSDTSCTLFLWVTARNRVSVIALFHICVHIPRICLYIDVPTAAEYSEWQNFFAAAVEKYMATADF